MSAGSDAGGSGGAEEVRRFLDEALRDHVIDDTTRLRLRAALEHREAMRAGFEEVPPIQDVGPPAPERPDAAAAAVAVEAPELPAAPAPREAPSGPSVPPTWWKEPQPAPERAAWAAWLGRLRELVSSDLALHGLAYLGVLLVFVGVFGFVVFAFGELDPSLRPVAEATIPLSCFLAAWFLHHQRAPHVASALELLGGLTLPLVAYASFVDDGAVPPDLSGDALVLALAGVSLAICVAYAAWSVRHPDSILRYLVAPMAWMVVWALGLWFAEGTVAGVEIRQPNLWQMAGFTLAVVLSIGLATAFPERRFARETRVSAIGGLALGYGLVLATGYASGWEAGPIAVAGATTIVGIDLLMTRLDERAAMGARLAQSLVVAFTAAALVPDLDPGWTGAAVVLAAIALLERWTRGRAGALERGLALGELVVGLAMAWQEPWAAVVAFGAASVWTHMRRVIGFEALGVPARAEGSMPAVPPVRSVADVAVAVLPVGVGVGLWEALGAERGLLVSAIVLLVAAAVYKVLGTDLLISIWLMGAAAAVDAATLDPMSADGATPTLLAATMVAAGVVLAAAPGGVPSIWLGGGALAWAGVIGLELAGLDPRTQAEIWAAVGLAAVLVGTVASRPSENTLHLQLVGLVVGGTALGAVVVTPDGARLACLGAWTLGWVLVVAAGEVRGRPRTALGDLSRDVAPPAALMLLAILAVDSVRLAGLLEDHPEIAGVVLSALALAEAAASRALVARRLLAEVVAWSAFAVSVVGLALSWPERWSLTVACAALIGVVVVLPAALRIAFMTWSAWTASALLTLLLAERAGVPTDQLYGAGFVWSSVVLLGGLALDTRAAGAHEGAGEGAHGVRVQTPWLVPPVVLGAVGLATALVVSLLEPRSVYGWWMLGGAAVTLGAALLLREPRVSAVPWGLAAFGAGSLAHELVIDEPWIFVAAAAVMLGAAWVLSRVRPPEEGLRSGWDLPPFVVGHAVAAVGLVVSASNDELAPTWLAAAVLALAVAAVVRRWEWAVTGAALGAVGAWDLGPAPLAAVLGVESVAAGIAASRLEGPARGWLQIVCAALAAGAWTQAVGAIGWGPGETRRATAIASGAALLAAGVAIRLRTLAADWLVPAAALGAVGVVVAEGQLLGFDEPLAAEPATRLALGAAFAMAAVALGVSAAPAGRPRLRELSAVVAAVALGEVLSGLGLSSERAVTVLVASSVPSMVVALALWRTGTWRAWAPAIGVFSALAAAASLPVAMTLWPDRGPLVAALLACGVESAAAGLVLRRVEPLVLAPLLLMGAWIAFATEAFAGHPQWFTVPIGLTALAVVEVLRWDHRRRHESVHPPEIVALEIAGIAFLIGGSPIQVIQGSTWAGLVGVVLGILVTAWGALTRVRRRLWLGAGSAVGCLLLMVLVPLTRRLPDVASAEPWVLLSVVGMAVVVIATVLERGRTRLRAAIHHIGELLDGWE